MMRGMRPVGLALLLLLASALRTGAQAQDPAPLGWDPAIRRGTLANGMKYLVEHRDVTPGRMEARLVLEAGSEREAEDERGLAHACEHLAFNGSEHFPGHALARHFESIGVPIGKHANAFTFDRRVVFQFSHPSATAQHLERALDVLSDFAGGATLTDEAIEAERGILLSELRFHLGPEARRLDAMEQELIAGSSGEHRNPLGLADVLRDAPPERFRAFYRRWYRPDLMTVVLVGDVDVDAAVQRLGARLGAKPRPEGPAPPRERWSPPADRRVASVEGGGSGMPTVLLQLGMLPEPKLPGEEEILDASDTLDDLEATCLESSLLERMRALAGPQSALVQANVGHHSPWSSPGNLDTWTIEALALPGQEVAGAAFLVSEIETARVHGFTAREVNRCRNRIGGGLDERILGRRLQSNADRAEDLLRAALEGFAIPRAEDEASQVTAVIPRLSAAGLNALLDRLLRQARGVLVVGCPESLACPSADALRAAWNAPAHDPVAASDAPAELVPNPPRPGDVTARRTIPELQVEELRLSNGMRVLLRDAVSDPGLLRLAGVARGGTAGLDARQRAAAQLLGVALAESGTADHDEASIQHLMELALDATPFVRSMTSGCSAEHLEGLMQVVHAGFARPAFTESGLRQAREVALASLRERQDDPDSAVDAAFDDLALGGDDRFAEPTEADLRAVGIADLAEAHARLFKDPSEWTLVLVGSIDPEKASKLAARWLASIPVPAPRQESSDVEAFRPRAGVLKRQVAAGNGEKSLTLIGLRWRRAPGVAGRQALNVAGTILALRLHGRLREELGATYAVDAFGRDVPEDGEDACVIAKLDTSVERREDLAAIALQELRGLRENPLSDEEIQLLRDATAHEWAAVTAQDEFWVGMLSDCVSSGYEPEAIAELPQLAATLTARRFRRDVRRALRPRDVVESWTVPRR